ncbi:MAG: 3-deoxy-D-manno-octulosonic acid transferase [Lysobacteraceae bacterium SCN 69-123]|jgi:3-deoxy-D-manno-octulosonic-acid transferase|uniref:lipid IV(A) 3-deoxy-D-manno-octulosonic acid transferase n=1 Tax=Stenotrophomonas acidaminiphila TaxID=128780 RepID=UPI00086B4C64|nr:lipid IV(A) 3-deoxy-D-manno-octulosonic acid transferase [Stenotrophomonas acidaminiphila]MBN8802323.1 lipid IV(A) 3-deoxy-D-manno-octulosonic acid transferase [Stenotrophomonas acidaminiphila]MDF9442263.1 3-deoxy-D-manno-octulosonic acid transferase [Stenotrophomonas acidaminiphila]ODU42867.1 MAG: 3-deoxy-D-manno-octulosonic acid transferase [Xanthomonadaceae bacterium SCN 69-123]OJY77364.1 MAG: 3-deoxy-D-manno-octulosonic acid transferase [Stenotrophomonas sp. 69-14]
MRKDPVELLLRGLYSALLYLLLPITVYHLVWRGFRVREYFKRWDERYASYPESGRRPCVWLHAVSVGEVNAAAPVVDALRRQRPDIRWVITTITPTGSQRVRALWGDAVDHVYLPYDVPGSAGRFLDHFRPSLALILETELWPNLLFGCRDRRIPVYILNARLSARSLKGYRLLRPLVGRALRTVTCVAAQSSEDARRFVVLGARQEQVCALGNLKFDIHPPDPAPLLAAFHAHVPAGRVTWIAASTHEGEEQAVIDLHARVLERYPDALLLWAPRHPERFAKVEASVRAQGWRVATRSAEQWPGADTQVFVLNTLGELMPFFACAQVAFVGGSLQAIGGHNLLEPAAMGTAVITGPHLHNFAEISRRMSEAGALSVCGDAAELGDELLRLLGDAPARRQRVQAGTQLVANGRGALERTLELIGPRLPAPE